MALVFNCPMLANSAMHVAHWRLLPAIKMEMKLLVIALKVQEKL